MANHIQVADPNSDCEAGQEDCAPHIRPATKRGPLLLGRGEVATNSLEHVPVVEVFWQRSDVYDLPVDFGQLFIDGRRQLDANQLRDGPLVSASGYSRRSW